MVSGFSAREPHQGRPGREFEPIQGHRAQNLRGRANEARSTGRTRKPDLSGAQENWDPAVHKPKAGLCTPLPHHEPPELPKVTRSEERRVGKEGRYGREAEGNKKN